MAVATFDTLKFANTLKAAGVPPAQAEAEAQAFAEVIQVNLKELVTKDDLKREVDDAKKELKQEITDARTEAKQDLKETEQRVNAKIDNGIADLKVQMAQIKGELVLVRWMLGVTISGIVAILIRLFLMRGPIA